MKPTLRKEFRGVVMALAAEYGAGQGDLLEVARELAAAPRARRGRPSLDESDDGALRGAALLGLSGQARSDWEIARTVARRMPGHSPEATAHRLYGKMREPHGFYRMFPDAARIDVLPEQPFDRLRRALKKILLK
jgi:hypothetical protein